MNILVVAGGEALEDLLRGSIGSSDELRISENYQYLVLDIEQARPDVLVVPAALIAADMGASLAELKKITAYRHLSILVVSNKTEDRTYAESLAAVATFCSLPLTATNARALLEALAKNKELAERYDTKIAELEQLAMLDPIVPVYNKKYFGQRLESEMKKSKRHGELFAVVLVRVKGIDAVVDAYGPKLYERILTEIAQQLKALLRGSDVLCKVASDLFAAILINVQPNGGEVVAAKFRAKLGRWGTTYNGRQIAVQCLCAPTTFDPKREMQRKLLEIAFEELDKQARA